MENSFFIFTDKANSIEIERFHICTWEFNNNSSLVEFGFEVSKESLKSIKLSISLFIPWFTKKCETQDLYDKLCIAENSRFIFNDSIDETKYLKNNTTSLGVIHKFSDRNELCVLPVTFENNTDNVLTAIVNLESYQNYQSKSNIYFRFSIKLAIPYISMRKKGISKSTIIYDIKVNERRNISDDKVKFFNEKEFCKIQNCFSFNIIPNKYDIVFFDNSSLKNVRTLEYDSFNKYIGDKRVKKDELIVVFNKKQNGVNGQNADSFSFFSIYSEERIGVAQFTFAILLNIFCGFLFFIASFRNPESVQITSIKELFLALPWEIYFAIFIMVVTLGYFVWPSIINLKKYIANLFSKR